MIETALIWLNGDLVPGKKPCISAFDRGFTLGDGIFETIRAHGVRSLWLDDHLVRLRQGAEVLGIRVPLSDTAIAEGLANLLKASNYKESAVRLTLSRGTSERRGLWPPGLSSTPTFLATVAELPTAQPSLRLVIARSTRRNEHSPLSRIKSLNYGDNLIARREAVARRMDDALMLNSAGRIVCATVGNLFLQIGVRWRTPPLSEGALAGLARRRLMGMLNAVETVMTPLDVAKSNAGFVSNSLSISAVQAIEGQALEDSGAFVRGISVFAD
jgi:branched-chain amino acid aminotransferase